MFVNTSFNNKCLAKFSFYLNIIYLNKFLHINNQYNIYTHIIVYVIYMHRIVQLRSVKGNIYIYIPSVILIVQLYAYILYTPLAIINH